MKVYTQEAIDKAIDSTRDSMESSGRWVSEPIRKEAYMVCVTMLEELKKNLAKVSEAEAK